MRVVKLNGDLVGECFPVGVVLLETADDVAQRTSNEEVLLEKAQFLACFGVVVGVEDLADRFRHVLLAHGFLVSAAVERIEIELLRSFRFPKTQEVHCLRAVARNRNVVGNADEFAETGPDGFLFAFLVGDHFDVAVNRNLLLVLRADDFPR